VMRSCELPDKAVPLLKCGLCGLDSSGSGYSVVNGNGLVGAREWSPCLGAGQMVPTLPFPHSSPLDLS
jgi:hypothetical protein